MIKQCVNSRFSNKFNRNREIQLKISIVIEKFNYFRKIYLLTNEMEILNGFVGTGTK
jgi:hypothetical protein